MKTLRQGYTLNGFKVFETIKKDFGLKISKGWITSHTWKVKDERNDVKTKMLNNIEVTYFTYARTLKCKRSISKVHQIKN